MISDHATFENDVLRFFGKLPDTGFEQIVCPFCPLDQKRALLFTKGTMVVVRCKCGFVYNAHQPTAGVLDHFYKESDAMKTWADLKTSEKEKTRQEEKFGQAVRFIESQQSIKSLLDLGCGTGKFLALVKAKRPDIHLVGTDTHEPSLAVARKSGIEAINIGIKDLLSKSISYDCITMWGVLEHVKYPLHVLRQVAAGLKTYGIAIICVPNVGSAVVRKLWEKCYTFTPPHLWYFNRDKLDEALYIAGLSVIKDYTIEPESKPIVRAEEGFHNPYDSTNDWLLPKLGIEELLDRRTLNFNQGYKIVAIAQKLPELGAAS